MQRTLRSLRRSKRGGALAAAMLFMIMVTVAGTALLSMSVITRKSIVRNGIDVRLMIAAEAGIETMRGRFTLIQGVQDDWNWLNTATWTSVGNPVVNGTTVTVEALSVGGPSVPTARMRAMASASGKTRVIEYHIKVATFSDYAVFTGNPGTLGANYKCVGNLYGAGSMFIPYTGAQLLGDVTLTGTISHTNGEAWGYTFPLSNPLQNQTAIPFPTWAAPWTALEALSESLYGAGLDHHYGENTLEIIFNGEQYTRYFVRRTANGTGNGTVPTGTGWITQSTGATNYAHASLNNADYILDSETRDIPDEGVIYVSTGTAQSIYSTKDTTGANTNNFTQSLTYTADADAAIFRDNYITGNFTRILLLSGRIDNRRVSIACDHKIIVKQPIVYNELLVDPTHRRFWADGVNGKESAGALGFKEMLGVMSQGDIHPAVTWWSSLTTLYGAGGVTDAVGEYLPGHYPADTTSMDGVYLALGHTAPIRNYGLTPGFGPRGEHWLHGGLIAQGSYGGGLGNSFFRRNYDWDYRMRLTCPPYFLRAYNTSAVYIPGTWRTYEF